MLVVNMWLIFLVFLSGCLGRPGVQEETNSDSNYDYTYDDNTDDSEDEVSELDVPARFVSEDPQRQVERGQTAKLECAVESSGGGTIMWQRGNGDYLYVGKQPMKQEEGRKYGIELVEKENFEGSRLIVTSLSRLIIRETNSNDTGWYNCTQTASQPPQNQSHYLEVKEPGEFVITGILDPRHPNPEKNLEHRISCSFRDAKIRWTKGNESKTFSDNPDLRINTRKDSGTYVCHAGRHKKTVEVIVQYLPEVNIEQIHLTSQQGRQEFWVRCNVQSSPTAVVTWSRDRKELRKNETGFVQDLEGDQHTLQIASSLGAEAVGEFSCTATSDLGSVVATTRVTGLPCNYPRPLEGSLELVHSDPEDETVNVELCSNDDIGLSIKSNQHYGSGTGDVFLEVEVTEYTHFVGKGKETNMIDEGDRRGVEKPNVYFANEAEEVRLTGTSSRGLHGDLADDEVDEKKQTRANSKTQKNITSSSKKEVEARRSPDEKNSLTNNSSRELKERGSEGKKKSKRVMSSPWILILTILFLFILACIILAVLR